MFSATYLMSEENLDYSTYLIQEAVENTFVSDFFQNPRSELQN
jgi:hypothetical protein